MLTKESKLFTSNQPNYMSISQIIKDIKCEERNVNNHIERVYDLKKNNIYILNDVYAYDKIMEIHEFDFSGKLNTFEFENNKGRKFTITTNAKSTFINKSCKQILSYDLSLANLILDDEGYFCKLYNKSTINYNDKLYSIKMRYSNGIICNGLLIGAN